MHPERLMFRMMKKIILVICAALLLTPGLQAGGKKLDVSALNALVSEYRVREDFDVMHLGFFSTTLLKRAARLGADDPDAKTAVSLIDGVRNLTVVDFSDSPASVRASFASRVQRILRSSEMLMEMKDGESCMRIYGLLDEMAGKLRDLVLFDESGTLLLAGGSISLDALQSLSESL